MEDRRGGLFDAKNTTRLLISGNAGAFIHYIVHVSEFSTLKTYVSLLGVVHKVEDNTH